MAEHDRQIQFTSMENQGSYDPSTRVHEQSLGNHTRHQIPSKRIAEPVAHTRPKHKLIIQGVSFQCRCHYMRYYFMLCNYRCPSSASASLNSLMAVPTSSKLRADIANLACFCALTIASSLISPAATGCEGTDTPGGG